MSVEREVLDLRIKVARLEQLVEHLYQFVGTGMPEAEDTGVSPEIREMVRLGRKIEAIKLYREATGLGLKEAKDYIDELERRM